MQTMKALRAFAGIEGTIRRNGIFTASDGRAKELERRGIAVPVMNRGGKAAPVSDNKKAPEPDNKGAAQDGDGRPSETRQTGGQTGAATQPSSLPADPAPPPPISTKPKRKSKGKRKAKSAPEQGTASTS